MKGGAVVDRRLIVYILMVVAVVNLVAFANVQDGQAIVFFFLAFGVVYSFDKNVMLALIAAIVGTSMFRAVVIMREGMEANPDAPVKPKKADPLKALGTNGVQGMKSLMKQQEGLMQMAQNLQPLMQQASKLLEGLPDGVLEQAMNKLKKK
jgi:hypothetical protein